MVTFPPLLPWDVGMDSPHQMITLFSISSPTHGGLCYQFRVPSGFPSPRKFAVCSKEKNGLFALRHSICSRHFFDCNNKYLFLLTVALSVPSPVPGSAAGISATSEDIPNKIEDLRSECSSDFGGKDSVTSPDGEESGHGRRVSHSHQAASAVSPVSISPRHSHSCRPAIECFLLKTGS